MSNKKHMFDGSWKCIDKMPKVKLPKGVLQLRFWQQECINRLINSGYHQLIMNTPTGSGKSIAIMQLVAESVLSHGKKNIIIVPMKVIGDGFTNNTAQKIKLFDGSIVEYFIDDENDLCNGKFQSEDSKIKQLIKFLKNDVASSLNEMVIICTHSCFARAFEKMKEQKILHLFDKTNLWIDEAHHVVGHKDAISNKIGNAVKYFLHHKETKNCTVNLATATLFRGDRQPIISKEDQEKFYRFNLPYDEHFEQNCFGLKFSYDFLLYERGWFDCLNTIFKEKVGKTIVFTPHPNHKASSGHGKDKEVIKVLEAIAGDNKYKSREDADGIIYVEREGKEVVVVDLVDEDMRYKKTKFLRDNSDLVDVVIGINVPKEGFDWPIANREIIIGHKSSLNEMIQMMGRTFRHHETKQEGVNQKTVEIVHILPWVDKSNLDETRLSHQLNEYMKAIYASLILESVINPVTISVGSIKGKRKKKESEDKNTVMEYINDNMGDSQYIDFYEDVISCLVEMRSDPDFVPDKKEIEGVYLSVIKDKLGETPLTSYHDEIANMILSTFKRRTTDVFKLLKLQGVDVSMIDADIVKGYDPLGFIVGYTNDVCGAKNLREFRDKINPNGGTWDENYEELCRLIDAGIFEFTDDGELIIHE